MLAAVIVIASAPSSSLSGGAAPSSPPKHSPGQARETLAGVGEVDARGLALRASGFALTRPAGSGHCRSARRGLAFYRQRHGDWLKLRGGNMVSPTGRKPRSCEDARYLANLWRSRSFQVRRAYERWVIRWRVLRDPGDWLEAVRVAQRPYPGTSAWLISCSASEGGHGRWVQNSQGSGAGGQLQFMHSTFVRMASAARIDLARRGFFVSSAVWSWYSPLGQALAGAWGVTNGRRGEWYGSGC